MLKYSLFTFIFLKGLFSFSQDSVDLNLIGEHYERLTEAKTFEQKLAVNSQLKELLKKELLKDDAFTKIFSQVENIIALCPTDSSFRLFNWAIPFSDGTYQYECAVLKKDAEDLIFLTPRKEPVPTNFLLSDKDDKSQLSNVTTDQNNWIGALYYQLIQTEGKFNTYYTLLGWDGNDLLTNKKIIDVLWFNKNGDIKLGAPIFKYNSSLKSRIIFEFGGQNTMRMYTIPDLNRIILDHLSAPPANTKETTELDGIYDYYGADLSFDALDWENGYWILKSNINPEERNPKKLDDNPGLKEKPEQKDFISKENVDKVKQKKILYQPPTKQ